MNRDSPDGSRTDVNGSEFLDFSEAQISYRVPSSDRAALGHDGHAVVDVNCDKQLAAERALSVRWVRLTPAKGLEGRVSGTES